MIIHDFEKEYTAPITDLKAHLVNRMQELHVFFKNCNDYQNRVCVYDTMVVTSNIFKFNYDVELPITIKKPHSTLVLSPVSFLDSSSGEVYVH